MAGISSLSTALTGLPQFSASSVGEILGLGLDALGDLQQVDGALGRRGARPGGEGLFGGGDGGLDLRSEASGRSRILAPVRGLSTVSRLGSGSNFEPMSMSVSIAFSLCRS